MNENEPDKTLTDILRENAEEFQDPQPLVVHRQEEIHIHIIPTVATGGLLIIVAVAITRVVRKKRHKARRKRKRADCKKR